MMSFLLPFLAIMLVTSEWSQRTALVTFALEPRRSRVIWAKLVAALLLTVIDLVAAFVVGVVYTAVCEVVQPDQTRGGSTGATSPGSSSPRRWRCWAASPSPPCSSTPRRPSSLFVVYRFVLPGVFAALSALSGAFEKVAPWLDFQAAQSDISEWTLSGAEAWGHLIVSGALWLALPLGLGMWRILRAEVK